MHKYKLLLLIFFISGCVQNSPIEVKQHSLALPKSAPIINENELKSGNDYSIGYKNGNIRSDRVTINWQACTDANLLCYRVFRDDIQRVVIAKNDSTNFTDSSFVFQNTYYNFKVVALTQRGTGSLDTVRIKTPRFEPPSILGDSVRTFPGLDIFIYWKNRAEHVTSYTVERRDQGSTFFGEVATITDTFYVDSNNITSGNTYEYRIIANNQYESTTPSFTYTVVVPSMMNIYRGYQTSQSFRRRGIN